MYIRQTGRFDSIELGRIERTTADQLLLPVLVSDSLVALRLLAEIMLNKDFEKLDKLLSNEAMNEHWRNYKDDPEVDANDHRYAAQLEERLAALNE